MTAYEDLSPGLLLFDVMSSTKKAGDSNRPAVVFFITSSPLAPDDASSRGLDWDLTGACEDTAKGAEQSISIDSIESPVGVGFEVRVAVFKI